MPRLFCLRAAALVFDSGLFALLSPEGTACSSSFLLLLRVPLILLTWGCPRYLIICFLFWLLHRSITIFLFLQNVIIMWQWIIVTDCQIDFWFEDFIGIYWKQKVFINHLLFYIISKSAGRNHEHLVRSSSKLCIWQPSPKTDVFFDKISRFIRNEMKNVELQNANLGFPRIKNFWSTPTVLFFWTLI